MKKFVKILKYIVFILGGIILFGILISGCDKLRCYPQFSPDGTYLGIKCGGEW